MSTNDCLLSPALFLQNFIGISEEPKVSDLTTKWSKGAAHTLPCVSPSPSCVYVFNKIFLFQVNSCSCKRDNSEEPNVFNNRFAARNEKISKGIAKFCLVCGWILAISSIVVGFFFTVMYSLSWGMAKSLGWMESFFLAMFNFTALVDPIMVSMAFFFICQ